MTWQNIKDFFYETVGDTEAAQAFFVEDDVTAWANEALREAVERTEFADYHEDQVSAAATALVTLGSPSAIGLWRVEYDGEKLEPVTLDSIRRINRFWADYSATPVAYMLDEQAMTSDLLAFRLYPVPGADDDNIAIYAYGVQYIISDTSPTQPVNVPEWFAYALVFGMLVRAYQADTEMQSYQRSDFYRMLWDDALMRLRGRSYGRLNKRWEFQQAGSSRKISARNLIPEHIPEPA